MRLPMLLLAGATLAQGDCPSVLEGVPNEMEKVDRFEEVMDTACGRRNYTSAFWSTTFVQTFMLQLVLEATNPDISNLTEFKPIFKSVQDHLQLMNNSEAKTFIDKFVGQQYNLFGGIHDNFGEESFGPKLVGHLLSTIFSQFGNTLSTDGKVALTQTFKDAFGVVETETMRQDRINTAMRAIERFGLLSHNDKMAELLAEMYFLMTNRYSFILTSVERFFDFAENDWNATGISHLEIVPAVETLYLQYRTLESNETKAFVKTAIASLALASSNTSAIQSDSDEDRSSLTRFREAMKEEKNADEFNTACPSHNIGKCFKELSVEDRNEIRTTFPELFAYLDRVEDFENLAFGSNKKTKTSDEKNQETIKKVRSKKTKLRTRFSRLTKP